MPSHDAVAGSYEPCEDGVVMQVVLTSSMQGVGNFVNTGVLIVLLVIFQCAKPNHANKLYPYHPNL